MKSDLCGYLVVVQGIQGQVVSLSIKESQGCQQLKDLHLHHDVRRVQR